MLVLVAACCGCGRSDTAPPPTKKTAGGEQQRSIHLVIDSGEGRQSREADIPWQQGMTALDALLHMGSKDLPVRHRGSGMTAFVEAIGGFENTVGGKNWLFYVNEKKSEKGAGVIELEAGDTVLWKYTAEK